MAFLRLLGAALFVLSVVYVCLFVQLRRAKRRHLADEASGMENVAREAFVDEELAAYTSGMWRWLAVLVYVLPIGGFACAIYLANMM